MTMSDNYDLNNLLEGFLIGAALVFLWRSGCLKVLLFIAFIGWTEQLFMKWFGRAAGDVVWCIVWGLVFVCWLASKFGNRKD